MRVDRSKFLLALSAMAAACGAATQDPPNTITTVVGPTTPPEAAPSPIAPEPKPAVTVAVVPTSEGITPPPSPASEGQVAPSSEGQSGPSQEGTASTDDGAMCRAKTPKRPNKCDDDRGNPGDCKKAHCDLGFVCQHCEDYKRYFKPKIAERAVSCVVAQSRRQASDGCRTYQCGDEALKGACIDPSADAQCKAIAKSCKTTVDECRGMLSGMNAEGRAKIATCAAKGCPYGLWSCVEGI